VAGHPPRGRTCFRSFDPVADCRQAGLELDHCRAAFS
jgi:hypothetical protein